MEANKKEKIIGKMQELADAVDARLDTKKQTREDITYYDDFEFKESNLAVRSVYIVEISNENNEKTADKSEEKYTTYEIYDKNGKKIADVDEKGKIYFDKEFTEKLKQIDSKYLEQLNIDDIEFELPEKLSEKDVHLTREELSEEKERNIGSRREKNEDKKDKNQKEEKEEENQEKETEEEKKQKTAEALGIDETEIKSISTIDLNQKVTDKYTLRDMLPEAAECKTLTVAYTKDGNFTLLGTKKDGTRENLNSVESIEGASTNKNVISINEDGSKVEEKQVKGLMRINARNREDGLSISVGDYGMMNIDYVNNVMDKENRRATPIRTEEAENQRITTERVRENAGDSKDEMTKEGKIYKANEEKRSKTSNIRRNRNRKYRWKYYT